MHISDVLLIIFLILFIYRFICTALITRFDRALATKEDRTHEELLWFASEISFLLISILCLFTIGVWGLILLVLCVMVICAQDIYYRLFWCTISMIFMIITMAILYD